MPPHSLPLLFLLAWGSASEGRSRPPCVDCCVAQPNTGGLVERAVAAGAPRRGLAARVGDVAGERGVGGFRRGSLGPLRPLRQHWNRSLRRSSVDRPLGVAASFRNLRDANL